MGTASSIAVISEFNLPNSDITGSNNKINTDEGFNVYPNPTRNSITVHIQLPQNQDVEFFLYNLMGDICLY